MKLNDLALYVWAKVEVEGVRDMPKWLAASHAEERAALDASGLEGKPLLKAQQALDALYAELSAKLDGKTLHQLDAAFASVKEPQRA